MRLLHRRLADPEHFGSFTRERGHDPCDPVGIGPSPQPAPDRLKGPVDEQVLPIVGAAHVDHEPGPERGDHGKQVTLPVEELRAHEAGADLVSAKVLNPGDVTWYVSQAHSGPAAVESPAK